MQFSKAIVGLLVPCFACLAAVAENLSDQLPPDVTMADLGLGTRPLGPPERAVRVVEWAALPNGAFCQQIAWRGDKLYFAIKEGPILEYALDGTASPLPFLDVDAERGSNFVGSTSSFTDGVRGFAFHPAYETNGLVYTMHRETGAGGADLGFTSNGTKEYVLGEWTMGGVSPVYREVVRIGFMDGYAHRAQNIGFNPVALPGDPDFAKLYCCFGDNTMGSEFDSRLTGQDVSTVLASVIRIDPLDPSGSTDQELAGMGLKRSANGNYSIPLANPFVGQAEAAEEIFAKGMRNPMTLHFTPTGIPMVGDVGQNAMEEINLLENGGNYGWGVREGTFAFTMADQATGDVLGADASLTLVPYGDATDPATFMWFRDKDGSNLRLVPVARTSVYSDMLTYPVAQFSHEGNEESGSVAIAAGEFYSGFWAEELEGLYLFGNFASDTLFYVEAADIANDNGPAEVFRLPLVDAAGTPVTLASIIGQQRADMRFGRDAYGNLYMSSKTSFKIYRFQGTPEAVASLSSMELLADGKEYPVVGLVRPGPDPSMTYTPQSAPDLGTAFANGGFVALSSVTNANGTMTEEYRYTTPFAVEGTRFFRFGVLPAP